MCSPAFDVLFQHFAYDIYISRLETKSALYSHNIRALDCYPPYCIQSSHVFPLLDGQTNIEFTLLPHSGGLHPLYIPVKMPIWDYQSI